MFLEVFEGLLPFAWVKPAGSKGKTSFFLFLLPVSRRRMKKFLVGFLLLLSSPLLNYFGLSFNSVVD